MTTRYHLTWNHGLRRSLQQRPDEPATIFAGRTRTFREQADRVARVAGALLDLGLEDGGRVGLLALNSDRAAEVILAIPWAGGVINVMDTMRATFEMGPVLAASQTEILFVDDAFAAAVPEMRDAFPGLRHVIHIGELPTPAELLAYEALIDSGSPVPEAGRCGDDLAVLLHTGGTTGPPKGVTHSHHSMLSMALTLGAMVPGFVAPGTRLLQLTPMSHMSGVGSCLMESLFGRTYVPMQRFDPAGVLEAIDDHRITALFAVPTMLQRLVDHPDASRHDLSTVHTIMYGASPMTESVLERVERAFPEAGFTQLYGMSEGGIAAVLPPEEHHARERRNSVGRSTVNTQVRVVDRHDRDVPIDQIGEILLRGANMMDGYWNAPEETAEVMRGGWVHTGDVGRLDQDGYLYVVDRLKDMVVVDGDNVSSSEVEDAVSSHPDVAACAVIGVPDDGVGERVHGVVVPTAGSDRSPEQLRKHCAARIAGFKVPTSWDFVEALPTSATGKVLKRELRRPYWEGRERQVN